MPATTLLRYGLLIAGLSLLLVTSLLATLHSRYPDEAYWLTFISSRTKRLDRQVYRMRADGRLVQQLTVGPQTRLDPTWSPDGAYIYFTSLEPGDTEIFRVRAEGGPLEQITDTPGSNVSPHFGPDTSTMVFISSRFPDGFHLYQRDMATGRDERLTLHPAPKITPALSPDGRWVVYNTLRHGPPEIYRLSLETGEPQRLTDSPGGNWYPDWSPDGRHVTFASDRGGVMHIYTMWADGSDIRRLTHEGTGNTLPAWSPGGSWIAYVSERDAQIEIWRMRADGSQKTQLTASPGDDLFPAWGPAQHPRWWPGLHVGLGVLGVIGGWYLARRV